MNAAKPPSSAVIAWARAPVGSPPPPGFMICQNIEWLACPPPLFRTAVRIDSGNGVEVRDQVLDRLALMVRMVLERVVQVRDISLVVLAVVNLHGLGVDVRLEGAIIVRQRRQGVFRHGVVLSRWSNRQVFRIVVGLRRVSGSRTVPEQRSRAGLAVSWFAAVEGTTGSAPSPGPHAGYHKDNSCFEWRCQTHEY